MKKISINENAYPYPMPMVVLGTLVEDRPNFMAVGWVTRVNFQPPMIAVALGKGHYTNGGIHATGAFSVNIPGIDLLEKVDYCGLVSGEGCGQVRALRGRAGREDGRPADRGVPALHGVQADKRPGASQQRGIRGRDRRRICRPRPVHCREAGHHEDQAVHADHAR